MEEWEEYVDREYRDGAYRRFELAEEKMGSPDAWAWPWAPVGLLAFGLFLVAWAR